MAYRSFEELEVWRKACDLAIRVYELLNECRDYGLKDQMTRSAVSIASNIAEGAERGSKADFARFLNIAKGSAAELRTQVYIASKVGIIQETDESEMVEELRVISRMLQGLVKSCRNSD